VQYNSGDDTWLNEARAEYSEMLLGYPNIDWNNSLLKTRLTDFVHLDSFDFINWQNSGSNYASVNLFTQYLVEHYGVRALADTLKNNSQGIASLNISLSQNGYTPTFTDIYRDWAIANAINDCNGNDKYCYLNDNLGEFVIAPQSYYLPSTGDVYMTASNNLKPWEIKYQKIVGGHDNLQLSFEKPGTTGINRLNYIIVKADQSKEIKAVDLTGQRQGTLNIPDFGKSNMYVILLPYLDNGSTINNDYVFVWKAAVNATVDPKQAALIANLLKQIETLKQQLTYLLALKIGGSIPTQPTTSTTCAKFTTDLKYGMISNNNVRCLQKFLASQPGIYPLGLITGNYLTYTELAVSDFQDETGITPTGYFGPLTRAKVNSMLGF
jgi:peptidoglycan hydrolase-like protein with peptidoglycan-binding domain